MFTEQHAVNDSEAATCRFHFSLSELASQRSGPCLGPCRGAQPMLFIQKKVSAEPSGDVGARRYQAHQVSKTALRKNSTLRQAWTLFAASSLIFRRPSRSGLLRRTDQMALETFALPFWQENFRRWACLQCHIPRGRGRLHSLVIFKPGLHPAVVQLLRWLVQDQLEVDFGSPVLSNQLDKAGSSFPLSPKALAGLANPASTSHSSPLSSSIPRD